MLKHNIYFDGQVQSIGFERNGLPATVGVLAPGTYHFNTGVAERMHVISGLVRVNIADRGWASFAAGTYFEVPGDSRFAIEALDGPAAYLCEFIG